MCPSAAKMTLKRRGAVGGGAKDGATVAAATAIPPGGGAAAQAVSEPGAGASRLRNALFPIYGEEVRKFLLIGSIKFFVILALTLTRDNKDTMVVTECGAEAIAFLKVRRALLLISSMGTDCG